MVFENISGTYVGSMVGLTQGVSLTGTFGLTMSQAGGDGGNISGSYIISGTLNDGVVIVPFSGTGTLTGTIASGQNPSLEITVRNPACPNFSATFAGIYDSTNLLLTLTGPIDFWDANCNIILTYPSVIILSR